MITWFEIPVTDMSRAKSFYEEVFNIQIHLMEMDGVQMGWFPNKNETGLATGTLIQMEEYKPSNSGVVIYFNSDDVANEMSRVEAAGGKILIDKRLISEENGYFAQFIDSEGNRIALHSLK